MPPSMTSSTTTSQPKQPGYVKGLYKDVYKDINKFYNKGDMPVYTGPTTAGLTRQQNTALGFNKDGKATGGGMLGLANANAGQNGMGGNLQDIMSSGGFNAGQLQTMGQLRGLADNAGLSELINGNGLTADQNKAYGGLQSTVYGNNAALQNTFNNGGLTADQSLVADRYRTGMNEQFGTDAAYNRVKQDALDASAQGVTAQAARMGRLGGGANQNILARAQGSLAANMDTAEMDKWRARTNAAAGNLAGLSQQGLGNQMGINSAQQAGLQNVAGMGQMGVDNRANAINQKSSIENSLFNMNQAGLANMDQAYKTAMQPYETKMGVGNILQQQQQNVINDRMRIFDAKNPMNAYQQFLGLASGMPTGQVQTTQPSALQMALTGGLGGLGLLGGLGMFGGGAATAGSAGAGAI